MIEQKNRQPERLANRFFLRIAGRRLRAYSIVPHVGRRSGREYRNPVGAYPLGDGFVIAVLYGRESQWVRNVMASGRFTLRTKGRDYQLEGQKSPLLASTRRLPAPVAIAPRVTKDRRVRVGTPRSELYRIQP